MEISDVRIRLVNKGDNKLKAVASITIDECFVVHDIKIIDSAEGAFIAMPSRKTNDGDYKDIAHPLNTATRDNLKKAILTAYYDELKK
ncbi:MAG: septation regulator SpoVG [Clostridia bacterium]|jgi:stage V sporulation protein G|nr:septation regulator SpoVG [Clostridia bacterium]